MYESGTSLRTAPLSSFSVVIFVVSLIGFFFVAFTDFGGLYITGYYSGYRYSCLVCEYSTLIDWFAIVLATLLLLGQMLIGLNDLLQNKFLPETFTRHGFNFAISTLIVILIGGAAFAIAYSDYEWWFESGFYGGAIAGLINSVLFFLKDKAK